MEKVIDYLDVKELSRIYFGLNFRFHSGDESEGDLGCFHDDLRKGWVAWVAVASWPPEPTYGTDAPIGGSSAKTFF